MSLLAIYLKLDYVLGDSYLLKKGKKRECNIA